MADIRGLVLFKQWLTELPVSLSKCRTVRDYPQGISVRQTWAFASPNLTAVYEGVQRPWKASFWLITDLTDVSIKGKRRENFKV